MLVICFLLFIATSFTFGLGFQKTKEQKLMRMLDVLEQREPAEIVSQKSIALRKMLSNAAPVFKHGNSKKTITDYVGRTKITVQQFDVVLQSGTTCGFHAAYNMSRFIADNTWPAGGLANAEQLCKGMNGLSDFNDLGEREVATVVGNLISEEHRRRLTIIEGEYLLSVYLCERVDEGQFVKVLYGEGKEDGEAKRLRILKEFKQGLAIYFLINTGAIGDFGYGHWLPFKFEKTKDGGVLVTTADSIGSDITGNPAIKSICNFLLSCKK